MGIFGLSGSDRSEILEFPKTYGVILRGMHQDLSEMHNNIDQHKDLVNEYIKHSKSLQDKFELEVTKVYDQQERTKVFLNEAEKRVSEGLGAMKEMARSLDIVRSNIERKYDEIISHSKDFDLKLLEIKRIIDNNAQEFDNALDNTNRELEFSLKNLKALESRLDESGKQITRLKILVSVTVLLSVVSIILHLV
jgi:DNA repair exonuclease SbcCD ATPase subunit